MKYLRVAFVIVVLFHFCDAFVYAKYMRPALFSHLIGQDNIERIGFTGFRRVFRGLYFLNLKNGQVNEILGPCTLIFSLLTTEEK